MAGQKQSKKVPLLARIWTISTRIFTILGLTTMLVGLGWKWTLPLIGEILIVDDAPSKSRDVIVIMMGETALRAEKAIDLYRQGYAAELLFVHPEDSPEVQFGVAMNDGEGTRKILLDGGVPVDAIHYSQNETVTSTKEEVASIFKLLGGRGLPTRVIVVTSWYHTSRLRWNIRRANANPNLEFEIVPAFPKNITAENWYQDERSFLLVFEEYLKWAHTLISGK